jgi:hypothetical protein
MLHSVMKIVLDFFICEEIYEIVLTIVGGVIVWYIRGCGTQEECLTQKSLSKHYPEWPNIYKIIFFVDFFYH